MLFAFVAASLLVQKVLRDRQQASEIRKARQALLVLYCLGADLLSTSVLQITEAKTVKVAHQATPHPRARGSPATGLAARAGLCLHSTLGSSLY